MSTIDRPRLAPLVAGERLDQPEFHQRYSAMPDIRCELIEGIVHMPSPLGDRHGHADATATGWLFNYRAKTPGVRVHSNSSVVLGASSEVQPDVILRILPENGGASRNFRSILAGPPELVLEIAASSRAVDLGIKLAAYERAGVLEYLVLAVDPDEVFWHVRRDGKLVRINADPDGIYRSSTFPGLWLDPVAIFADDPSALLATLDLGLASPEHAAFVVRLDAASGG